MSTPATNDEAVPEVMVSASSSEEAPESSSTKSAWKWPVFRRSTTNAVTEASTATTTGATSPEKPAQPESMIIPGRISITLYQVDAPFAWKLKLKTETLESTEAEPLQQPQQEGGTLPSNTPSSSSTAALESEEASSTTNDPPPGGSTSTSSVVTRTVIESIDSDSGLFLRQYTQPLLLLQPGDILETVNYCDCTLLTLEEIQTLLEPPVDEQASSSAPVSRFVSLTIQRPTGNPQYIQAVAIRPSSAGGANEPVNAKNSTSSTSHDLTPSLGLRFVVEPEEPSASSNHPDPQPDPSNPQDEAVPSLSPTGNSESTNNGQAPQTASPSTGGATSSKMAFFWQSMRQSKSRLSQKRKPSQLIIHEDLPLDGYMAHSGLQAGDIVREIHGLDANDTTSMISSPLSEWTPHDALVRMEAQFASTGFLSFLAERPTAPQKWTFRRAAVAVGGGTMVTVGSVIMATPLHPIGHAMAIGGVGVLATEFEGPKRMMKSMKESFQRTTSKVGGQHPNKNDLQQVTTTNAPTDDPSTTSSDNADNETTDPSSDTQYNNNGTAGTEAEISNTTRETEASSPKDDDDDDDKRIV